MFKARCAVSLLALFFVLGIVAKPEATIAANTSCTFNRNLSLGSSGSDVKALQQLLNQSSDTRVAAAGTGSPGKESTYFGPATRTALIKYQNKYANQVLKPSGLTYGTGLFGPSTRAYVNTICNGYTPTVNTVTSTNVAVSGSATVTAFTHKLTVGSRDATTNGEVTKLQTVLKNSGYFKADVTGYFGTVTASALNWFQKDQGISGEASMTGSKTIVSLNRFYATQNNSGSIAVNNVAVNTSTTAINTSNVSVSSSNVVVATSVSTSGGGSGGTSATDTTPPVISGGSPSGTLSANTTSTTLSLTTNESATCKYSTGTGSAFGSMTTMTNTGGSTHTSVVYNLSNSNNYHYYIKCQDAAGNVDPSDYAVSFSIAAPTNPVPEQTGSTFAQDAAYEIDYRIIGKTGSAANTYLFSTQNNPEGTYVWNSNNFLSGVDMTGISPWNTNGKGPTGSGTLISPDVIIYAAHYPQIVVGSNLRFVKQDGTVVTKTVTAVANVSGTDIELAHLDSRVPSGITPFNLMPSNWASYVTGLSTANPLPVISMLGGGWIDGPGHDHSNKEATVEELYSLAAPNIQPYNALYQESSSATRASFYIDGGVSGDSGNPRFFLINGKLVLISCMLGPSGDPFTSAYLSQINSIVSGWGGVQPTTVDLSSFTSAAPNSLVATAGSGGTINPTGTTFVTSGSSQTYTITVNTGYVIDKVLVDGSPVTLSGSNTYTFSNVTSNHTISASFTVAGLSVVYPAGGETWSTTTAQTVRWTSTGLDQSALIKIVARDGSIGDANFDGKIDFADFVVLSNHSGAHVTCWATCGDFNNDGVVDFADFVVQSNHNSGSSDYVLAAGVPNTGSYSVDLSTLPLGQTEIIMSTNNGSVVGISNGYIAVTN